MGAKETVGEYRLKVEASANQGAIDLKGLAEGERDAIKKYAGLAEDFAQKYAKDNRLTLDISPSDPPELKLIKRDMNKLEDQRLASVQKTSQTISSVTNTSAAVASAIYPPAGAAVMVVGAVVNMAYNFFNSGPSQDWSNMATGMWSQYQMVGLPRPLYADGFDNPKSYVMDKLQRGVGFGGIPGFGQTPDEYQARYDSSNEYYRCTAWIDAKGGGYLHTAPPDVFRALYAHNDALMKTAPPPNINVQSTMYQASPYLAYQYNQFAELKVAGASGGKGVPVWFWWRDCNLSLCAERPVPLYVRDANDMKRYMDNPSGVETLPTRSDGVPFRQLFDGQVMIDTFVIQMALTAAISQGLPTWASGSVIETAKTAWADYRKQILEAYAEVYASGGNGVSESRIGKITGVTPEGNLVGKFQRNGASARKLVNRGANGLDAMGYVFKAAMEKAAELSAQGLSVANVRLYRPAWVTYAKKADFQFATVAERKADLLELSPAAKAKLAAKKGATQALVVPSERDGYRLSDAPQYVANPFSRAAASMGLSTGSLIALGVGGVALVGGGYYFYRQRR